MKYLWAVAIAAALAGCGGGSDTNETPQAAVSSMQAQLQVLPEAQALPTASATAAANQLMDFVESRLPTIFSGPQTSRTLTPFLYRYYPASGTYLIVVTDTGTSYTVGDIFVLGGPFGAAPRYIGPLTSIITPTTTTTVTNKTLVISGTVNVLGQTVAIPATSIPNITAPTSQTDFCGVVTTNSTYLQAFQGYTGSVVLNSCSFSGNVGTISATITSPSLPGPVSFVATYTFQ